MSSTGELAGTAGDRETGSRHTASNTSEADQPATALFELKLVITQQQSVRHNNPRRVALKSDILALSHDEVIRCGGATSYTLCAQ